MQELLFVSVSLDNVLIRIREVYLALFVGCYLVNEDLEYFIPLKMYMWRISVRTSSARWCRGHPETAG